MTSVARGKSSLVRARELSFVTNGYPVEALDRGSITSGIFLFFINFFTVKMLSTLGSSPVFTEAIG